MLTDGNNLKHLRISKVLVLNVMKIRIDTDNPLYESVKDYFCLEIVPRGYFKLLEKIGQEGINNLHFHEIEQQALLNFLRRMI